MSRTDTFWTLPYKGHFIRGKFVDGEEVIEACLYIADPSGSFTHRQVKSIHAAKCRITRYRKFRGQDK